MSTPICGLLKRMVPAETGFPRNVTLPETGQSFSRDPLQPDSRKPITTKTQRHQKVLDSLCLRAFVVRTWILTKRKRGCRHRDSPSCKGQGGDWMVERFREKLYGAIGKQTCAPPGWTDWMGVFGPQLPGTP